MSYKARTLGLYSLIQPTSDVCDYLLVGNFRENKRNTRSQPDPIEHCQCEKLKRLIDQSIGFTQLFIVFSFISPVFLLRRCTSNPEAGV